MSRIQIIHNSTTSMDAQLAIHTGDLPDLNTLRDKLSPQGQFQPWTATVIGALGSELLAAKAAGHIPNITFTVTTHSGDWTIDCTKG